jgi:signal transduction histidine kinase
MRGRTLGTQFLVVVLLGAVLPLVIVGLWLTDNTARAGRRVLNTHLEQIATALASGINDQWLVCEGDVQLLASNEPARRMVVLDGRSRIEDQAYLSTLGESLRERVTFIRYLSAHDSVVWQWNDERIINSRASDVRDAAAIQFSRSIQGTERDSGRVDVGIRVTSLVPESTDRFATARINIALVDSQGPLWSRGDEGVDLAGLVEDERWSVWSIATEVPGVRLLVGSEVSSYIAPFQRSAAAGLGVLMLAALVATGLSVLVVRRLSSSLSTLAVTADDLRAGRLDSRAAVGGSEEMIRLADAFNSMAGTIKGNTEELSKQRSLAAVGEFAASLSHDVRNSLTAVRIDLQHARMHLDGTGVAAKLVARALSSITRLDASVTGALKVSRLANPRLQSVHIFEVLEQAVHAASPTFGLHEASLEYSPPKEEVHVSGDSTALEQLFLNLLLNAAQSSERSGTTRMSTTVSADTVRITVEDNGSGISNRDITRVGQPFHTTKLHGTGLGLSIARRIAEAHGGTIEIHSIESVGTQVEVVLPRARIEESSVATAESDG